MGGNRTAIPHVRDVAFFVQVFARVVGAGAQSSCHELLLLLLLLFSHIN